MPSPMAIDYFAPLANGRQLGTTPGDLSIALLAAGVPITGYKAIFSQPHPSDNYLFTGEGIKVTAQQIEEGGMAAVKGSIGVAVNSGVSEESIRQAILRYCLGLSTITDTK